MQQGKEADDVPDGDPLPSYSWRAEYVCCRMILQKLEGSDEVDAEGDVLPLSALYHGADSLTVRQRPQLIRTLRAKVCAWGSRNLRLLFTRWLVTPMHHPMQVAQLERSHVGLSQQDWQPGSMDFNAALVELAESEISQLGHEIKVCDAAILVQAGLRQRRGDSSISAAMRCKLPRARFGKRFSRLAWVSHGGRRVKFSGKTAEVGFTAPRVGPLLGQGCGSDAAIAAFHAWIANCCQGTGLTPRGCPRKRYAGCGTGLPQP